MMPERRHCLCCGSKTDIVACPSCGKDAPRVTDGAWTEPRIGDISIASVRKATDRRTKTGTFSKAFRYGGEG